MKNLYLIIICCLLFINAAKAQTTDEKVASKLAELRKAGVDTIVLYYAYCVGAPPKIIYPMDSAKCHPGYEKYLFWVDRGTNYIERFNECYSYNPIKNKSLAVMQLIKLHYSNLKKEFIKPIEFRQMYKGKMQTFSTSIDHSCRVDINFYIGKKTSKYIDDFILDSKFVEDFNNPKIKHVNINYAYNQHTYLKQLKDLIQKEIDELIFNPN